MSDNKLTLNDPVDAETLTRMGELQNMRLQLASRLLDLEQDKIRLMRAANNVDTERARLFEGVNISRGLPPGFPVEVDPKTGLIKPLEPVPEAKEEIVTETLTSTQ